MTDLLQAAVAPPNLIPTALLVFVVLYWLTVLAGRAGGDALDPPTDNDSAAPRLKPVGDVGSKWLNQVVAFFNLGRVPLMFWFSFVAVLLWIGSLVTNDLLQNASGWLGLTLLTPLLTVSLIIAKFLTMPFARLFASTEKIPGAGEKPLGKICTVLLPATHEQLGEARVRLSDGTTLTLSVRALSPNVSFRRGDQAVVIYFDDGCRCYLIDSYDGPSRQLSPGHSRAGTSDGRSTPNRAAPNGQVFLQAR